MKRLTKLLPWLLGLLCACLTFIILSRFTYFRYENSDDILFVKAFMGFEGGQPATYQLNLHPLLSHVLAFLSRLVPGVAWFSLLQIGALWFSSAVIVKCLCQIGFSAKRLAFRLISLFCSFLYIVVFVLFPSARINFTTTAALLAAAGVVQLCTQAVHDRFSVPAFLLSVFLLLCSYMLRSQSLVAALPFWLLALCWLLYAKRTQRANYCKANARRLAAGFLTAVVACAALLGIQVYQLQDPEIKERLAFLDAYVGPMDYAEDRLLSVSDDALADIGWSRAELTLVQEWYFMDENITAEAFTKLDAALSIHEPPDAGIVRAFDTLSAFYRANPRYQLSAALLLLLSALLLFSGRRPLMLAASAALLLTFAMLFYLAFQGRFLARAADCALLPAAALLLALLLCALPDLAAAGGGRRVAVLALCALCLITGGFHAYATKKVLSDRPDTVSATREADLEAHALANPDTLFLRTPNLLRDTRLFPDVSAGIPANILIWGDWNCRTPSWYRQLEKLGFDGRHFTASSFLKEELRFVTADETPPQALLVYLSEQLGREITPVLTDERGELRFFAFE